MKKTVLNIVREWAVENRATFWKYEVASFYQTYKIHVGNLPNPSETDISVTSNSKLLNANQKKQLSNAIKKACSKMEVTGSPHVDVKIDFIDGAVKAVTM